MSYQRAARKTTRPLWQAREKPEDRVRNVVSGFRCGVRRRENVGLIPICIQRAKIPRGCMHGSHEICGTTDRGLVSGVTDACQKADQVYR